MINDQLLHDGFLLIKLDYREFYDAAADEEDEMIRATVAIENSERTEADAPASRE